MDRDTSSLQRSPIFGGMLAFLMLTTPAVFAAFAQSAGLTLNFGSEVTRLIRHDEEHVFLLESLPDRHISITLKQKGVNIGITVFDPGGVPLISEDVQKHVHAAEHLFFTANRAGTYKVRLTPLPGFDIQTSLDKNAFVWDGERSVPYELVNTSGGYTIVVNDTPATTDKLDQIDKLFRAQEITKTGGVAVGIVDRGKPLFLRGYGQANLEYEIPVTEHTPFHIASVSKQFAGYAIAALHVAGKLSLDDDIRQYLPELKIEKKISIRQMLNHTSGIRDQWVVAALAGWRMDDVITQEQLLRLIFNQEALNFNPGDVYRYSNSNYTLAAEIVRRVTGKTLREWTSAEIFEPLGMTQTFFYDDHEEILPGRAYSYDDRSGTVKKSVLSFANSGATSLFTTVHDFVKWMPNFSHPTVGNSRIFELLCTPGKLNDGTSSTYGLGVAMGTYKNKPTINHSGVDAGYRSFMLYFPAQELGIIVLSNQASCNTVRLAQRVADILLDLPPEKDVKAFEPKASMQPYDGLSFELTTGVTAFTGVYYNAEIQTEYRILERDSKLLLTHKRFNDVSLIPTASDQFKGTYWIFDQVKFRRDDTGNITGLSVSNGGVTNMEFTKQNTKF